MKIAHIKLASKTTGLNSIIRMMSKCGFNLRFASEEQKNNKDVVLAAVRNVAWAMEWSQVRPIFFFFKVSSELPRCIQHLGTLTKHSDLIGIMLYQRCQFLVPIFSSLNLSCRTTTSWRRLLFDLHFFL